MNIQNTFIFSTLFFKENTPNCCGLSVEKEGGKFKDNRLQKVT